MEPSRPTLIVGLGNPGEQYEATRHNVGFMVIDRLLSKLSRRDTAQSHEASSFVWRLQIRGRTVIFQKPQTYMNLSGDAVAKLARTEQLTHSDILVIYDDVDLPLGRLRFRTKGSSGGHNGLESIIQELNSGKVNRLRIGIGRSEDSAMIDHVLEPFSHEESEVVEAMLAGATEATQLAIARGIIAAMNDYNGRTYELNSTKPEPEEAED